MTEEKTIWHKIKDALQKNGIEAYPPATKYGECKEKYVVIKQDGGSSLQNFSTEVDYYVLLLYVPQREYASLHSFEKTIKKIMADEMYPTLVPTGLKTPDFFDDTFKAHMTSIQYRNNVRNIHL